MNLDHLHVINGYLHEVRFHNTSPKSWIYDKYDPQKVYEIYSYYWDGRIDSINRRLITLNEEDWCYLNEVKLYIKSKMY